jgi:hypothetical protein
MNSPREATAPGEPCTHTFKCLNCKGNHQADDYKCPYFQSRFDRDWHKHKAAEEHDQRMLWGTNNAQAPIL